MRGEAKERNATVCGGEERRREERRGEAGSIASYRYLRERCIEEEQLAR